MFSYIASRRLPASRWTPQRRTCRPDAQQQGDGRHCEGEQAVFDDGVHIALFNAKVDDERHDGGQQDVHDCFQCGKHRRQESGASVFAQMGSKLLLSYFEPPLMNCLVRNNFIQNNIKVNAFPKFRKKFIFVSLQAQI